MLASSLALSSLGRVQGESREIWLGPEPTLVSPTLEHTWDAGADQVTGMLLGPSLSPVTNPFHPPDATVPHPMGFSPLPPQGAGKLSVEVAGTWCSPGGFPVLSGALGRLSHEPQGVQGLFPIGAHIALAQEGSRPGCLRVWKSPRGHEPR